MTTEEEIKKLEQEAFSGVDPNSLPDELKGIYKSMQADYTRKTQALADQRKDFDTKETSWKAQLEDLGALKQETEQWRNWYKGLEEEAKQEDEDVNLESLNLNHEDENVNNEFAKYVKKLEGEVTSLKDSLRAANDAIKNSNDQTIRMFDYHAQLTDLAGKYPNLDKSGLLKHAMDNNITDLNRAYEDLHREDIIKGLVKKGVDEELARIRTDGIQTGGREMIIRPKSEKPTTWSEATEKIVQEKAAAGTLGFEGLVNEPK